MLIHPEVVLERDCRERLTLLLNWNLLLGLNCLMESVAPAPSHHQAPRKFIDDHYLVLLYHIVAVFKVEGTSAKGILNVVDGLKIFLVEVVYAQNFFYSFDSSFGQGCTSCLLVNFKVCIGV